MAPPDGSTTLESSASGDTLVVDSLPREVVTCLKNARFLHLATCNNDVPHVSLMNYTYFPTTPFTPAPTIVMTTNPVSQKTHNLFANPKVSLLVHDWVSHRPPTRTTPPASRRDGSPPARTTQSSLATMLANINTSALSRISATINGSVRILDQGSEEERWCKEQHLQNNTFGEPPNSSDVFGTSPSDQAVSDGGRGWFIDREAVRVIVVAIRDGRIADWKGGVQDWVIAGAQDHLVNGA